MHLNGLWLQNFRCFADQVWQFEPGRNLFVAPNGSGKSNLIESIRLLSTGRSWRSNRTEELIAWDQPLAQLQAKVQLQSGEKITLEQALTDGSVQGKRTATRRYKLNGVGKRKADVIGELQTVLFTPEDMLLFQTGPAARRELLDNVLIQADKKYQQAWQKYEQALKRRNKMISLLREGQVSRYDFFYYDELLIQNGEYLQQQREKFLNWLTRNGQAEAETSLVNQISTTKEIYQTTYDPSPITAERLRKYANAEVGAGYTLVGPHKDDWQLQVKRGGDWRDIVTFGSRGEQRLALVWFKLQEVEYLTQLRQEKPVVLLDDVFSELDERNSELLLESLHGVQSIITTVPGNSVAFKGGTLF